jgi:DNA polymerase elongation subunit (family B)
MLHKYDDLFVTRPGKQLLVVDWDIETVAAGFADPEWVPQKITCVAWSFVGEEKVESRICGPEGLFGNPKKRADMLKPLIKALNKADMWTGHNLWNFDIPVLVAECQRLGLPLPKSGVLVQDTIKMVHAKGFKKGQDNLGQLFKLPIDKLPLSWQQWQDGYDEKGWQLIRERCETDVLQHKLLREEMIKRGWLQSPKRWYHE